MSETAEGLTQPPLCCPALPFAFMKVLVLTSSKATQSQGILSKQKHKIKFKITENLLKGVIIKGHE